jgi:hypothetical protein
MREPAPVFTPLPLRARNVLELLDTSLKVYKQYFWVLMGWSAIINIFGALASTTCGSCGMMVLTPIFLGVAACCVSAAVRGQNVTFGQCWQFAQARFGGMLGWYLLTMLISFLVIGLLSGIFFGIGFAVAPAFSNSASLSQGILITGYVIVACVVVSIVGVGFLTWAHLAPLVVCMEENNPNKKVLPRSWELMAGHWGRGISLMSILSLAALALIVIIYAAAALIIGIDTVINAFDGSELSPSFWVMMIVMVLGYALVFMLFTPAWLIAMVLFYLDLRVRKDALDLEWTTHSTGPSVPVNPTYAAPAAATTVTSFQNLNPVQTPVQTPVQPSPSSAALPATPVTIPATPPATPTTQPDLPVTNAPPVFEVPHFEAAPPASPTVSPSASPSTETTSWQSLIEEPGSPSTSPPIPLNQTEITCPACSAKSPAGYAFCMSCGAQLPSASDISST